MYSGFILGRNILKGLVALSETIDGIYMKRMDGVLIKMYFEKSYDRVKSSFLQQTLTNEMIPPLWCEWVTRFVQGDI
jgi:hypothetical protein